MHKNMNTLFYPMTVSQYDEACYYRKKRQDYGRRMICQAYEKAVDNDSYEGPDTLIPDYMFDDLPVWMNMVCAYYGCYVTRDNINASKGTVYAAGNDIFLGESEGEAVDIALFFTGLALATADRIIGAYGGGIIPYHKVSHWRIHEDTQILAAFENGMVLATVWGFDTSYDSSIYNAFRNKATEYVNEICSERI